MAVLVVDSGGVLFREFHDPDGRARGKKNWCQDQPHSVTHGGCCFGIFHRKIDPSFNALSKKKEEGYM